MTALYIVFHTWRGFSFANAEPDLFRYVWVLGFVSVHICRVCLLSTIHKLRAAAQGAIGSLEQRLRNSGQ